MRLGSSVGIIRGRPKNAGGRNNPKTPKTTHVLDVLLAVEGDLLGLDLAILHVDLVAAKYHRDRLAHPDQVSVPRGDVLVGDPARDVEHDDRALAVDVCDPGGRA